MKKLVVLYLVFLCGCSSTSVLSSWKAPQARTLPSYRKIMVVSVMGERYDYTRQVMEHTMVKQLTAYGINAVSAFETYGPAAFRTMSEKEVLGKLDASGADAAMTIVLLDRRKEKYYTPGRIDYYPSYYMNFWGYYSTMYDRVYTPGYYTTTIDFFLETNIYQLKGDQLQYAIQTRTSDPAGKEAMAEEVSEAVVKDLSRKQMLK